MDRSYAITLENGHTAHDELLPLYREHYAEMKARLEGDGIRIGDFSPRTDQYFAAMDAGWLLTFIVRHAGKAVGYSNIYITNDMHNGERIAQEDTIFITAAHRNGIGRRLALFILAELRRRGVKRVNITAMTDLRVAKIWQRMGFRPAATVMTYIF
jgi:GNAT superfamily N-acetyltransferase